MDPSVLSVTAAALPDLPPLAPPLLLFLEPPLDERFPEDLFLPPLVPLEVEEPDAADLFLGFLVVALVFLAFFLTTGPLLISLILLSLYAG